LPEFKEPIHEIDAMRATARLPNSDIEIVHRRALDGDSEQVFINMQAAPSSFETFGRLLEAANPFAFWAQASRLVWLSWMDAAKLAMLPFSLGASLPTRPRSGDDRQS
jgi:hypothetical protein